MARRTLRVRAYTTRTPKIKWLAYSVHVRWKIISRRPVWQPLFSLHYFHYDLRQSSSGIQVYLLPFAFLDASELQKEMKSVTELKNGCYKGYSLQAFAKAIVIQYRNDLPETAKCAKLHFASPFPRPSVNVVLACRTGWRASLEIA